MQNVIKFKMCIFEEFRFILYFSSDIVGSGSFDMHIEKLKKKKSVSTKKKFALRGRGQGWGSGMIRFFLRLPLSNHVKQMSPIPPA